jgi:hypothetical protein
VTIASSYLFANFGGGTVSYILLWQFLVHDSEDIIASGAGDDAICIFTEEKSTMVCCPNIYVFMIPVLIWCV